MREKMIVEFENIGSASKLYADIAQELRFSAAPNLNTSHLAATVTYPMATFNGHLSPRGKYSRGPTSSKPHFL